jgi:hypothetical protein
VVNNGGNVTYTPNTGFSGIDSFTYVASDGADGSNVATVTVTVGAAPNLAPVVTITAPADGSSVIEGDSITFTGTASDAEDGILTANLDWSSSLDGSIGTGGSFSTSTLTVGTHIITASAMDSGGLEGSATVTVTVDSSGGATTYGVSDFITNSISVKKFWTAEVTPIVTDDSGIAVNGAAVTGHWDDEPANPVSCTTDISGQCASPITRSGIRKRVGSVTFTVDTVSGGSLTWDGAIPSVTVSKP